MVPSLLSALQWQKPAILAAIEPSMHSTDLALDFARQGLPFRDAYIKAADPALWQHKPAQDSLNARVSEGSGVNLGLDKLKQRLAAL